MTFKHCRLGTFLSVKVPSKGLNKLFIPDAKSTNNKVIHFLRGIIVCPRSIYVKKKLGNLAAEKLSKKYLIRNLIY